MMMALYEDVLTLIANHLKCPICFELFTEPVSLVCGHSYCLQCIQGHVKQNVRRGCPQCRAELRPDCRLHKNVTICAILELQEVGGRKMWDRVLAGSEEELNQNGRYLSRDNIRAYESSSSSSSSSSLSSVDVSSSSLDCEKGSQGAENSSSPLSLTQSDQVLTNSDSGSEENGTSAQGNPPSFRRFSEGGTSAAAALSAEFIPLSFSPELGHRRLVFLNQRQRMEVRSGPNLRTQLRRFHACQWMAEQEFTTGRRYWDIETSECSGWAAGVAYARLGHDERLGRSKSSWCVEWSSGRLSAWHDGSETPLKHTHPSRLRVLLDMDAGRLTFWSGADGEVELYGVQVEFGAPVRPVFWLFGTKLGNALSFPRP